MHKGLLIPGVALLLAGCVASQTETAPVRVDDLSTERAASTPAQYTVKSGDTLYGIAWRHDMDYRDLAEINDIGPPYEIQPGQRLVLNAQGADASDTTTASGAAETDDAESGDSGAVASGVAVAGGVSGSAADGGTGNSGTAGDDESLDWLLPADAGNASGASGDSESAPGPVYEDDSSDSADTQDSAASDSDDETATSEADDTESEGDTQSDAEQRDASSESTQDAEQDAGQSGDDEDARVAQNDAEQSASESSSQAATDASSGQDRSGRQYTPVDPVPWQWPTSGSVVGNYGEGDSITAGIDISGQKGQPVKAAAPGIVVYAGSGVRGYGNLILLKHNDQFLSAYAHNDALSVKENDVVRAGEVIASMGDSDAQDVRLHFEVRKDGQPQDPLEYLPAR
ncbi:peptidoglycan DD-metalloendopeptidase family protein [Halomonas sp. 18H]|uniref:peptidoglycan DD-metalloendopeptidase family protein n=1 Tax=Halomonas almeriensis TaxID=308163 RepID=UPI00222ECAB7|nr:MULTISPECIES: peptidoglycan DD-metalloendopeptidase family protein [Halomonas]MCW4149580.1 peptidoglycan DD-metalloendopeptidase family protein [Halomonas sp. 18H]MDN3553474.1 peptidoglycan DD-metalloendopeptidase family protein [Halomonas almeriensis]